MGESGLEASLKAIQQEAIQQSGCNEKGVQALVHYPTPLHLQPSARSLGHTAKDFPVTMAASGRILSLPIYPGLTDAQQDLVADLISDFYNTRDGRR